MDTVTCRHLFYCSYSTSLYPGSRWVGLVRMGELYLFYYSFNLTYVYVKGFYKSDIARRCRYNPYDQSVLLNVLQTQFFEMPSFVSLGLKVAAFSTKLNLATVTFIYS